MVANIDDEGELVFIYLFFSFQVDIFFSLAEV